MGPGFLFLIFYERIPGRIAQPPIRSNDEWGAYSLIGLSNGQYLVLSWITVRASKLRGQVTLGFRQSIKHLGHADVCLERSRAAHHSEVCFVFGGCFLGYWLRIFSTLSNGAGDLVLRTFELVSPLDSLLSCVYNVQYFSRFVKPHYAVFTLLLITNRFTPVFYTKGYGLRPQLAQQSRKLL